MANYILGISSLVLCEFLLKLFNYLSKWIMCWSLNHLEYLFSGYLIQQFDHWFIMRSDHVFWFFFLSLVNYLNQYLNKIILMEYSITSITDFSIPVNFVSHDVVKIFEGNKSVIVQVSSLDHWFDIFISDVFSNLLGNLFKFQTCEFSLNKYSLYSSINIEGVEHFRDISSGVFIRQLGSS